MSGTSNALHTIEDNTKNQPREDNSLREVHSFLLDRWGIQYIVSKPLYPSADGKPTPVLQLDMSRGLTNEEFHNLRNRAGGG